MKFVFLLISLVTFSSFVFGQQDTKPAKSPVSFAGKWVINKSESVAGVGGGTMVVTQNSHEIVMISTDIRDGQESIRKTIYVIDGQIVNGDVDRVIAKWEGKKLVRSFRGAVATVQRDLRSPAVDMREEWTLSKDGNTLTQTLTGTGMPETPKFVYTRLGK
ncbi:MAG: hypothetical protein QM785_00705 [Pyrinomonadaceae bacterium]